MSMDFGSLAAAAVTVIAPYVPELWKGIAERTGGAVADASFALAKHVYDLVSPPLLEEPEARSSLDVLADDPNNVHAKNAMSTRLAAVMTLDSQFAHKVMAMLVESNVFQVSPTSQVISNQGATIGKQVIISSFSGEGTINLM
jgi:hypothetical protein